MCATCGCMGNVKPPVKKTIVKKASKKKTATKKESAKKK